MRRIILIAGEWVERKMIGSGGGYGSYKCGVLWKRSKISCKSW